MEQSRVTLDTCSHVELTYKPLMSAAWLPIYAPESYYSVVVDAESGIRITELNQRNPDGSYHNWAKLTFGRAFEVVREPLINDTTGTFSVILKITKIREKIIGHPPKAKDNHAESQLALLSIPLRHMIFFRIVILNAYSIIELDPMDISRILFYGSDAPVDSILQGLQRCKYNILAYLNRIASQQHENQKRQFELTVQQNHLLEEKGKNEGRLEDLKLKRLGCLNNFMDNAERQPVDSVRTERRKSIEELADMQTEEDETFLELEAIETRLASGHLQVDEASLEEAVLEECSEEAREKIIIITKKEEERKKLLEHWRS
ncbi:MAG: hypothetical protein M1834_003648 [Cirrosporium novae-zelandiae]|nr:MAG: hypothetical protein M1834_003648 [Cirrosporium novae-zelandiae]